jgi:hypothetical protein
MRKMKSKILIFIAMILTFTLPCMAQGLQPEHFIWMGAGVTGYHMTNPDGVMGYGHRVADGFYLMTNLVMTPDSSTITVTPIKHLFEFNRVQMFALGEAGISTGNDPSGENITKAAFGAGGGLSIDVMKDLNRKLENFRVILAVKIVKPEPGTPGTGTSGGTIGTVTPQFYGGLSYFLR